MSPGYHGLLLVDKPAGITSHDVVAKARRWMNFKSIGHAGTLDPLATGLMVLLVGKGTKISDFILNGDKAYDVKVQLGVETDTDDIDGEVLAQTPVNIDPAKIEAEALRLQGALDLKVPSYSAIKQKGKKLYQMARKKQDFTPPTRTMVFQRAQVLEAGGDQISVHLECSKGSYIRSWAKTLGENLGVGAIVSTLRRTHSAPYSVENAVELNTLIDTPFDEHILDSLKKQGAWISLAKALPLWPSVKIEGMEEKLVVNGQIPRRLERYLEIQYGGRETLVPGVKVLSRRSGQLLSLLSQEAPLQFKIRRVFPKT